MTDAVDARIEQMLAREQILRLTYEYSYNLDMGLTKELSELFVDGAQIVIGDGVYYTKETLPDLQVEAFSATWHSVSNHVIDFTSDTEATGRCVVYAWHRWASDGKAMVVYGQYHDQYVLVDGTWRFARRELRAADHDGWHVVDLIPIGRTVGGPTPKAVLPEPS